MKDRPRHAPLTRFEVVEDRLVVGGETLDVLAARVGSTPFYAYDRRVVAEKVAELRAHMPAEVLLHYAIKANPMPALVGYVADLVDGLDVASIGELQVALDSGMDPREVSFAGPGKRDVELRAAVAGGVLLNVESEGELERLARVADEMGITPRVAVRVNPDFELKSSGMKMAGGPKAFGIDAERLPQVLASIASMELGFEGLHVFSGSQNLRVEAIIEAQDATFELAARLAEHAPAPVQVLNIGGGLGIPYFPGERPLDLGPIGDNLARRMDEARGTLPDARIVLELGRFLVGECGVYVARVVDRKISRGETFLVTDGGLHHHLAASGNFGQVIRKNYPVAVAHRVHGEPRETVSVVGPLCTPLDLLADRMELGKAEPGDLVAVFQSGAYGLTASPTAFLGHPGPAEIVV